MKASDKTCMVKLHGYSKKLAENDRDLYTILMHIFPDLIYHVF